MKPLQVVRERGLVIVRVSNDATIADWRALHAELRVIELPARHGLLLDAREASLLSAAEAREVGGALMGGWAAVALVATSGVRYGVARIVQAFAEVGGASARTFTDVADAETWLRHQVDAAAPQDARSDDGRGEDARGAGGPAGTG